MEVTTRLREYQEKAIPVLYSYLKDENCAGLLFDMSLGKTICTFKLYEMLLSDGLVDHAIIIAPKLPIITTWPDEIKKHCENYSYLIWNNVKTKKFMHELELFGMHGQMFFVNTESFQIKNKILNEFLNKLLLKKCLIALDESSFIKSPEANRTKNLLAIAQKASYRIIATGTEVERNILDIYTQGEFLNNGFWGVKNYYVFRSKYAIMGDVYGIGGRIIKNAKYLGCKDINDIRDKINSVCIRLKKSDCVDLPEKQYQNIELEMSPELRHIYDDMKNKLQAEWQGKELTAVNKAVLFGRFRQLCGGIFPQNANSGKPIGNNNKLRYLLDDLSDTDDQAIVWCNFVDEINNIGAEFNWNQHDCGVVFGGININARKEIIEKFQSGKIKNLIINASVGAYSLNLQNCSLVYWYTLPLRAGHYWQAEDRTHRPGMKKSCLYKTLIYKNSVDERVKKILDEKTKLREQLREDQTVPSFDMDDETFWRLI